MNGVRTGNNIHSIGIRNNMAEEEIWDSWEDFADSKDLDKHVDEHLRLTNGNSHQDREDDFDDDFPKINSGNVDSCDNGRTAGTQFRILPRPVVHEDDMNRTAYIPQVKILKRPGNDVQASQNKDKDKQKSQPARTLAEREAAYAEARKRIMGPVAGQSNSNTPATAKSSTANSGKSRPESKRTRTPKESNSVHVERQPKGPDKNGRGFNAPR